MKTNFVYTVCSLMKVSFFDLFEFFSLKSIEKLFFFQFMKFEVFVSISIVFEISTTVERRLIF
jgi:hypothetical protein